MTQLRHPGHEHYMRKAALYGVMKDFVRGTGHFFSPLKGHRPRDHNGAACFVHSLGY
jgi:hypothetical protein